MVLDFVESLELKHGFLTNWLMLATQVDFLIIEYETILKNILKCLFLENKAAYNHGTNLV